ncbi:MAG: ClpXP protease specificity-enhancing factor [Gammaproteobacteria bacterium]|nr:ClpXP protease specificity-enhancing factor [Gammaproteobacteria bacterium]
MPPPESIPQRPYLVRAMHEWIVDSGHTPHVVVDAAVDGVQVPGQYVRDGKIVLNIAPAAVTNLEIGNEFLTFQARFSGAPYLVSVPLRAVLGIYSRETGKGMVFSAEDDSSAPDEPPPSGGNGAPAQGRAKLRVVK